MMAEGSEAPRLGFLADGDPETDMMTALYEFDELGVRVRVPFTAADDVRGRWWSGGIMFMDDPHRTRRSYTPPSELDYFDNEGTVGLLGCWSGRSKQRMGVAGAGEINARYAVEGAGAATNYLKPNGFRSEIEGLAHWLGFSALRTVFTFKEGGGASRASTSTENVDDMPLARSLQLKAIGYATGSGLDTPEVTYRSVVFLETFTKAAREWDDHLELHRAVRNLLRVCAWQPINFQSHKAASLKETLTIKGEEKQTWRQV